MRCCSALMLLTVCSCGVRTDDVLSFVTPPDLGEPAQVTEIGRTWEEQGHEYDGVAWYRLAFEVKPELIRAR